jgi:hypothetical protein
VDPLAGLEDDRGLAAPQGGTTMIEAVVGLPGAGKTYEAVRRILLLADQGYQCYSVTPVTHPNVELITYDEATDAYLPPGWLLWDEVHLKLGSNDHKKLDPKWFEKLSQTRKDGHNLIYTTQHESKVLKQLRDNTNYGWIASAWGSFRGHPAFFAAKCWEMHKLRKGKPIDRYVHTYSSRVARAYDTRYAIAAQAAVV